MAPGAKDRADQGRRLSRLLSWTWRFSRSLSGDDMTARGQILPVPWPSPRVWSGYRENPLPPEDSPRTQQGVGRTTLRRTIAGNCPESARMDRRRPRKQGRAHQMSGESPPARGHNSDGPESPTARLHPANLGETASSRDRASPQSRQGVAATASRLAAFRSPG